MNVAFSRACWLFVKRKMIWIEEKQSFCLGDICLASVQKMVIPDVIFCWLHQYQQHPVLALQLWFKHFVSSTLWLIKCGSKLNLIWKYSLFPTWWQKYVFVHMFIRQALWNFQRIRFNNNFLFLDCLFPLQLSLSFQFFLLASYTLFPSRLFFSLSVMLAVQS